MITRISVCGCVIARYKCMTAEIEEYFTSKTGDAVFTSHMYLVTVITYMR